MSTRRPKPGSTPADEPSPTLRHNPFAALKKDGSQPTSSLEVTPSESAPRAGGAGPQAGALGAVVVRREKKGRGGKGVTIAEGAGLAGRDLEALARELARALGAGVRVEDGGIVVQGEQMDRLVQQLEQRGVGRIVRGN